MSDIGARIVLAASGAAMATAGLLVAANFRGCATWYARRSQKSLRWLQDPLRRISPWKRLLERPVEERVAEQAGFARVFAAVFACTGLLLLVAAFVATNITTS